MTAVSLNTATIMRVPMETTLKVRLTSAETALLDRLVRLGLFATKSEAVRTALLKYGTDLGFLRAENPLRTLARRRRRVTDATLRRQVKEAEDGTTVK